jgi:hypothetical protein
LTKKFLAKLLLVLLWVYDREMMLSLVTIRKLEKSQKEEEEQVPYLVLLTP